VQVKETLKKLTANKRYKNFLPINVGQIRQQKRLGFEQRYPTSNGGVVPTPYLLHSYGSNSSTTPTGFEQMFKILQ